MVDRKRSVNLKKLNEAELEQLSAQIGDKVRGIMDAAIESANKILVIYGLRAKMQLVIEENKKEKRNK
jgi:hypothetical protein